MRKNKTILKSQIGNPFDYDPISNPTGSIQREQINESVNNNSKKKLDDTIGSLKKRSVAVRKSVKTTSQAKQSAKVIAKKTRLATGTYKKNK